MTEQDETQQNGYSIAVAEGPDGQTWLRADDVARYINDTAQYVRDNNELDTTARAVASSYLTSIAAAFAGAEVEPATEPADEPDEN